MTTEEQHVRTRVLSGARWVLFLNLGTLPLAILTSMAFGNVSPETLGQFGAVDLYITTFQVFFVLGGPQVFARFVPAVAERDRFPFLLSYLAIVLGVFAVTCSAGLLLAPTWIERALARVGAPSAWYAFGVAVAVVVLAFSGNFLFGVLRGSLAAISQRSVMIGLFVAAALGFGPLRDRLVADPAKYIWASALAVYGAAALLGLWQSTRVDEFRRHPAARWFLPRGFWSVVAYTHLATIVSFVYYRLSPMMVLVWLDKASLGFLHAALRYEVFARLVPLLLSSVLAPGLSHLDSAGLREDVRRHARFAIDTTLLAVAPALIALAAFAGPAMRIFGPEFVEHRDLLRLLVIGFVAGPVIHIGSGILVAIGAFRQYLAASAVYVVAAVALTVGLVPVLGLPGAAMATSGGALVQQAALLWVLRSRLDLRVGRRVLAASFWTAVVAAVCLSIDPGIAAGTACALGGALAFAWTGGVTPAEVRRVLRLAFPSRS